MKTDPELGVKVRNHLYQLGLETVVTEANQVTAHQALHDGVFEFLNFMGLDTDDPSIQETPTRVADMFVRELCAGLDYNNFPKCTTTPNGHLRTGCVREREGIPADVPGHAIVEARNTEHGGVEFLWSYRRGAIDEMVMLDSINTYSLCEHHFQVIHGQTHIAYIPREKILGVSKFARVTNFFGRRPQIQERFTEQVYAALAFILDTPDIAVQQVCVHNCIRARGAMDPHSKMTTSKLGGVFRSNPALRAEFLHGIKTNGA